MGTKIAKTEITGIPQIQTVRNRTGSRIYYFSPDWCKKQTWYHDAIQAAQAAFTGNAALTTFQLPHGNTPVPGQRILDLNNGWLTNEMFVFKTAPFDYVAVIKIGGVTKAERRSYKTSGGDYQINYVTGLITFFVAPALNAAITVDYWYVPVTAKGTIIVGPPPTGKKWLISQAEAQFASDIDMTDTIRHNEYSGAEPGTPLYPWDLEYRRFGNFLDYGFGSFPVIPAMGGAQRGVTQSTQIFRFDYARVVELLGSSQSRIKLWLEDGIEFGGERATFVLYGTEENE